VARWRSNGRSRKTGTMGTLASQAKIGVWVRAPGDASVGVREYHPPKNLEVLLAKSCNLVQFGVLKHVNNGKTVPTRFPVAYSGHCLLLSTVTLLYCKELLSTG